MTDAPPFPLQNRIAAALTTACPRHSHCDLMGPAVWAVVQDEFDRLRDRGERARIELDALRDLARGATDLREQLAVSDRLRASGLDLHEKVVRKLVDAEAERDQLKKLAEEALHLRQHGEHAPGDSENWRDWERKAERALRAMLEQQTEPCADHRHKAPE